MILQIHRRPSKPKSNLSQIYQLQIKPNDVEKKRPPRKSPKLSHEQRATSRHQKRMVKMTIWTLRSTKYLMINSNGSISDSIRKIKRQIKLLRERSPNLYPNKKKF